MNNKIWAWPMTNWLSHLQWFFLWMRSVCVAVWLRLLGMFNLNDGRWGRGDEQPSNTANGSDPGQPTPPPEGNRRPPPSKGPPDLDELWQELNRKLGQLFGGKVGPDITGIRNQPADAILLHILVPNYEVAPNYQTLSIVTQDGRSLSGWLAAESESSLTLRTAAGGEESIARSHLTSLVASGLSLMPDGLEQTMAKEDMANLVAFLKSEN